MSGQCGMSAKASECFRLTYILHTKDVLKGTEENSRLCSKVLAEENQKKRGRNQ
jgi:hypothetical protein